MIHGASLSPPMKTITPPPGLRLESPIGYAPILDGLRPWLGGFSGGKDSAMVAARRPAPMP